MFKSILLILLLPSLAPAQIKAGKPIDYSKLAFYPKRWETQGHAMTLTPWNGKNISFLTISADFDEKVMSDFVATLDQGWDVYRALTGKDPVPSRVVAGKAPIAAVPGRGLTCGFGCGYVGHTGIEMNGFYPNIYNKVKKSARHTPHVFFYEMGRNFFTFGKKHDAFTTGFAVFMRYVCIDTLKLADQDPGTRKTIDQAITNYAKGDLPFLKTFTNAYGLTEKKNRLNHRPTDQPVMYASAMLSLWKARGDKWLKSFFQQIHKAPSSNRLSKEGARQQALSWYLASSLAAKKDLASTFVEQWRFPLTEEEKTKLAKTKWDDPELNLEILLKELEK